MTDRILATKDLLIAPSILAANFGNLTHEIASISNADLVHVDVMDGHFVPNISFGPNAVRLARQNFGGLVDAHLMVSNPDAALPAFIGAKPDIVTFHIETTDHANRLIQQIHDAGIYASVALNPATPVTLLEDVITDLDMVLIMSVNPGFGGQDFIPRALDKIRRLRHLAGLNRAQPRIEVDGGITCDNAAEIVRSGADVLVAGSSVFSHADRQAAISSLLHAGRQGLSQLA